MTYLLDYQLPQPSSSPIHIITLSCFEYESLLVPKPSPSSCSLVTWCRDLVTAQQLAYPPSPPMAQMLTTPQLSSSPILLSNGVREQNRNPLTVPQLLAAACQMRIPPRDGFRLFVCPSSIFSTFFKPFSIVLITNYIQLLQPLRRDEEGSFPSLLIALNTLSDEHSSSSHSQPHSASIPGSHFTIEHCCLPWHRHATPKSQNLTPQHLGLGISMHGSDAMMDTTALRIQERIYLLRMVVFRWAVTKLNRHRRVRRNISSPFLH